MDANDSQDPIIPGEVDTSDNVLSNDSIRWQGPLQPYQRPLQETDIKTVPSAGLLTNNICEHILQSSTGIYSLGLDKRLRNTGYTTALFKVSNQGFLKKFDNVYILGNSNLAEIAKAVADAKIAPVNITVDLVTDINSLTKVVNSVILVDNDFSVADNLEQLTEIAQKNRVIVFKESGMTSM